MAKLTIDGIGAVTVDDSFKSLPPEQQAAVVDEIAAARGIGASAGAQAPERPTGIGNNIGAGLLEGGINLAGLPRMGIDAAQAATGWVGEKLLGRPLKEPQFPLNMIPKIFGPSPQESRQFLEPITGPFPQATTPTEKLARAGAEGIVGGAASMPRNLIRGAATMGVVPGLTSEYAGQLAEGSKFEIPSRIAGALAGVGAGAGINKGVNAAQNAIAASSTARELSRVLGSRVGAGASRRVADSLAADSVTPTSAAARTAELGPEAMVLDVGRQARGRAEAVAAQPGRGQNTVLDAVEGRTGRFGEGTAQRVEQTLNREMGPTHNVVELVDRVDEVVKRVASPLYKKVMDAHPVLNVPSAITERPAVAQAMKDAVQLARQHGENIAGTTERRTILRGDGYHITDDITHPAQTSLRYWDYVKKDLDRRINAYQRSGGTSELNSADKADLAGLMDARRTLVSHLDEVTEGAYREARQAAATKYQLREALDFGRGAFNTKLLPEEFAAELAEMSVPQRTMAQVGFRRELDRIIEATRNEGATARRVLDTNHVMQKAELLYGRDAVREIERRIGAENTFQEATQDIARNSRTAVRQQAIKDTSTPSSSEVRGASLMGIGWAGARGGLNYIREHGMERTRSQMADILTASGPNVDPTVRALLKYGDKKTINNAAVGSKTTALINALISGQ